jgi:hypothetical protein
MTWMQNRGGKVIAPGLAQQIFLDSLLANAIIAEGCARCFLSGGNLDARAMNPYGSTVEQVLNAAAKRGYELFRALRLIAGEVDYDLSVERRNTFSEVISGFLRISVKNNEFNTLPG